MKPGDRVTLVVRHSRAGESGVITNTPGKVFNGWTVRLDSGIYAGASERQISPSTPAGESDA